MSSKKVVVTGGAGFIGSHVVRDLLAAGYAVAVVDNLSSGYRHNLPDTGEVFHELDIRAADLAPVMAGASFVVHLAALVSVPMSIEQPELNQAINVDGANRVFEASRAAGVRRVVYASSAAVYGDAPGLPKRECDTPAPQSPYAEAKLANEVEAARLARVYGLETVGLRFFNVFGERQDPSSMYSGVISIFANRLQAGQGITVFGDGEQTRDFVYVGDVARAIRLCLEREAPGSGAELREVFNVGRGEQVSLLQLIAMLCELLGKSVEPAFEEARVGDIKHSLADIAPLSSWTGWSAEVDLKQGLRRLLET